MSPRQYEVTCRDVRNTVPTPWKEKSVFVFPVPELSVTLMQLEDDPLKTITRQDKFEIASYFCPALIVFPCASA